MLESQLSLSFSIFGSRKRVKRSRRRIINYTYSHNINDYLAHTLPYIWLKQVKVNSHYLYVDK